MICLGTKQLSTNFRGLKLYQEFLQTTTVYNHKSINEKWEKKKHVETKQHATKNLRESMKKSRRKSEKTLIL